jgi:hypothetical protein
MVVVHMLVCMTVRREAPWLDHLCVMLSQLWPDVNIWGIIARVVLGGERRLVFQLPTFYIFSIGHDSVPAPYNTASRCTVCNVVADTVNRLVAWC